MKLTALFVGAFVAASLGMPLEMVQHEQRTSEANVVKLGAAQPASTVPVRIALSQRNLDRGMELLLEVADPDSPKYGQHYTKQQVVDTFAPAQESIDTVTQWLVKAGIPEESISISQNKGYLDFKTTISSLESLLKTSYHVYENQKTSAQHLGADSYSLPADVAPHVDFVWPAVISSSLKRAAVTPKNNIVPMSAHEIEKIQADPLGRCSAYVTPECIAAMYDIPPAPKTPNPNNALGIFEIGLEMYSQDDLDLFYNTTAKYIPKGTGPKLDLINLDEAPPSNSSYGQSALDFDMVLPIIYPQATELYQIQGGFLDFLAAVDSSFCEEGTTKDCGTFEPANVISFSWGGEENPKSPRSYKRQCNEFMKLGLQGTTVVWSSGDNGVAGNSQGCLGKDYDIFAVDDPAGCPYALAIGATTLTEGGKPGDEEIVTTKFSPGGGFSNIFSAPDYQKNALATYFAKHDPGFPAYNATDGDIPDSGHGIYNRIGRGYPDISAIGQNGVLAFQGELGRQDGTSMSAPIIAAMLNRINEERLAAGKKPVGFVNAALYKNPDLFRDVTKGRMRAKNSGTCNGKGFSATPGWDPVTGLGTPSYPTLSKYFNKLP